MSIKCHCGHTTNYHPYYSATKRICRVRGCSCKEWRPKEEERVYYYPSSDPNWEFRNTAAPLPSAGDDKPITPFRIAEFLCDEAWHGRWHIHTNTHPTASEAGEVLAPWFNARLEAAVKQARESIIGAITDPENQPSQWGTVLMASLEARESQLAKHHAQAGRWHTGRPPSCAVCGWQEGR